MPLTISGSLAIDETSGTQNASSTSNVFADNDVSLATLSAPAGAPEFDLLLAAVAGTGVSPTGVSVSNADAAHPTGTPLITGLGPNVTNLAFTDSAGQPLDGDVAKFGAGATDFLMTADGYKIFLYSYSALVGTRTVNGALPADLAGVDENNAVFGIKANVSGAGGVADPNGALIFAAYLQPTNASGVVQSSDLNAVGAKVWMVEYQPIQHGTAGSTAAAYDDARLLFDPLNVGVSTRTEFSLEGAPSGQNLFLMYADGSPAAGETAIVVTGKNPINQSIDSSGITGGDTVNTGQGGGKTTIGSNNQMIDPNEGMYFTFVKLSAASAPLTVPNLDQNEADVEANIDFDSYLGQTEAIFTVVQMQPPKAATLRLTALNNADGTEKGVDFIDGLNDGTGVDIHGGDDDSLVNISSVTITRVVKTGKTLTTYNLSYSESGSPTSSPPGGPLSDITVDFSGTTVKITGALAGDVIDYKTDSLHNRVLIDNVGNTDAKFNSAFDIGGFSLISASTVPTPFQELTFQDDGPTAAVVAGTSEVIVDESSGDQDDDVAGTTAFDPDGTGGNPATTLAALFAISGAGTDTNLPQYALSGGAVVASTGSSGGTDGLKSTVFSLAIAGGVNGTDSLLDTTDGKDVKLFKEGDLIVGRYDVNNGTVDATDPAAFAIAIDQGGRLAVAQYVSLKHPTAGDGTTPAGSHDERIDLTGLVNAVVTVTDNDNDTASNSTAVGDKINFDDDGPTAGIALGTSEVIVDESSGIQDDDVAGTTAFDPDGTGGNPATTLAALFAISGAGTDTNLPQYALSGGAVVASTGSSGGTDDAKSTVFSLSITGGDGTDSLLDTTDGKNIVLFKEGDLIVGRYDVNNGTVTAADPAAFAIAIDQGGRLAVAQYVSLKHPTPGNGTTPAGSFDERIDLTGLVNAVVTVTDNDNDTASTSTAVGDKINFDDDGVSVAFGNLIGTGSINPQYGNWTSNAGTDGIAPGVTGLDINVTGFTIVRPNSTTATGTATLEPLAGSPNASGDFLFSGTLSADFDNNPGTTDAPINYFLTALANGTYKLDLVEGFVSTTSTVSTIDGLTAGG
ncbi:DUF5801 repeats-in-toxin domain-containing protein, partial [Caenimonas soli]|uniref:DUF5801 repeats-in-toxin domain-containing protein n=1 Tax=Caenimonas soli TaxID=2735555 RepID=UPI001A9B237F